MYTCIQEIAIFFDGKS